MEPEKMRAFFKYFNRFMLLMWRLDLGRFINIWPEWGGQIMVITHTGRKTGRRRRTPVNYAIIDGDIYCLAGFGQLADWYRNLKANPAVEVWLPDGWWAGRAEEVPEDEPNRLALLRQVLIATGFAAPLIEGIFPRRISDEELAHITAHYCLMRIHRTEARTGPGGPGEWAWVWPVATMVLVALLWCRPNRACSARTDDAGLRQR